jgi:phospholipid/cholesterol/gamma-HCH transport system substrate-binding protein
VKRAIRVHRVDFAAIVVLFVLAIVTVGYVLLHQPAFTFGRSYYTVYAQFQSASAVSPGQGEAVTIAGVEVGTVGSVELEAGQARVTMNIYTRYAPIYRNATVLLEERTPLKDMYLSLDPGTPSAGKIPAGGTLGAANTQPVVDVDQVLSSLDADTRTYLLLLLSGGAQALSGKSPADLRAVFRRFPPLASDTRTFATLLAKRSDELRSAIHNFNLVTGALAGVDSQLASLVRASNTDFSAISSQDVALQSALTQLPGTLSQTATTLRKVSAFAAATGPALTKLEPFATELAPALEAIRPLARATTGPIETELRPFTTAVTPLAKLLAPAAAKLQTAAPALASSVKVINVLFNTLAHQPSSGHSYLYWASWLAHNLDSVTDTQDANGAILRGIFMSSCPGLNLLTNVLQPGIPSLTPLLDLLNAPQASSIKSSYCSSTL